MSDKTKQIRIGSLAIGGGAPVAIQSMTNTNTLDLAATLAQARALEAAGCEIIRLAVENEDAAKTFTYLKEQGIVAPLVADIHFDHKLALAAVKAGADKIRINPGNIGSRDKVAEVAAACRAAGVPIRVGVNGGSLEKKLLEKYGSPTPEALAESAFNEAEALESVGFSDIVISIKSSRVRDMIAACRIVSDGVGDTIRVSLTADPVREVAAAKEILSSLGMYKPTLHVVSCPTCSRTKIDLISLCRQFREASATLDTGGKDITVAIMGCAVNGPGEAREADVGIAGGVGEGLLFRHGEIVGKVPESEIIPTLISAVREIAGN